MSNITRAFAGFAVAFSLSVAVVSSPTAAEASACFNTSEQVATPAELAQLSRGMTFAEVEAITGAPGEVMLTSTSRREYRPWTGCQQYETVVMTFRKGIAADYSFGLTRAVGVLSSN